MTADQPIRPDAGAADGDAAYMIRLGNHPEVAVCIRCAHSLSVRARGLEDRGRSGVTVQARTRLRQARQAVVRRGWHNSPVVGRGLRWLGRFTP